MGHFIYILEAKDGRFYVGYSTDVEKRLKKHQSGKGAKFTRAFGAVKLIYQETHPTKSDALKREAQIKKLTRSQKEELVKSASAQSK